MAHTFHWTLEDIYKVTIRNMTILMEHYNDMVDKLNKELDKAKGKGGKQSIGSLGQLHNLPGVKKIKKKR